MLRLAAVHRAVPANSRAFSITLPSSVEITNDRAPYRYKGPLKAAILDWSGTTADAHVIAPAVVFKDVFKKHGVDITMEEARAPMGLRKDMHIAKILEIPAVRSRWRSIIGSEPTQKDVDAMFADFVPMQLACLPDYCKLVPGCKEAIAEIQGPLKMLVGSTTGFTRVMVDLLVSEAKKQGYTPDCTVAGDEIKNNMGFRPAPFMLYENLVNLGVFPIQSVVKVDDTASGVAEGLNAGSWTVGVAHWSNYTHVDSMEQWDSMTQEQQERRIKDAREILIKSGAHYVLDSIKELPVVCRHINERLANGETP